MKNLAYLLLAFATGVFLAGQFGVQARAQGTLLASNANPRTWPPRPESLVTLEVNLGVSLAPNEEVDAYSIAPDKWLVVTAMTLDGGGVISTLASRTSSGTSVRLQTWVGDVGSVYTLGPEGVACSPGSRITVRNDSSQAQSVDRLKLRGYLVDATP